MYQLEYVSPAGERVDLTPAGRVTSGPFLLPDGVSGLVGQVEDRAITSVNVAGQVLDGVVVSPFTGALTLGLVSSLDDIANKWAWFRSLFPVGRVGKYGTLRVRRGGESWSCHVRASSVLAPPSTNLGVSRVVQDVTVDLVCDDGFWSSRTFTSSGHTEITNAGDLPLWPSVVWSGAGASVTVPSGVSFTLPTPPSGSRVMLLDPHESMAVLDGEVLDRDLWPVPGAVAEGVPDGETRTFSTTGESSLMWQEKVFDPWR